MIRRARPEEEKGFTLVEVLLALLIAVMILGVIYFSFRTVTSNVVRDEERIERTQIARALLDRLSVELSSAVAMTGRVNGEDERLLFESVNDGESERAHDSLRFVTISSSDGRPRRVSYVFDPQAQGYTRIETAPWSTLVEKTDGPLLDPLITGMDLRFFDGEEWREDWNETEAAEELPEAVEVILWIGGEVEEGRRERAETRILLKD